MNKVYVVYQYCKFRTKNPILRFEGFYSDKNDAIDTLNYVFSNVLDNVPSMHGMIKTVIEKETFKVVSFKSESNNRFNEEIYDYVFINELPVNR